MGEQKFVLTVQSVAEGGIGVVAEESWVPGLERMVSPSLLWQDKGDIKLAFRNLEIFV